MTQKDVLTRALSVAASPYRGHAAAMIAARASCVIAWLHDMNLHPEANAIEEKLDSMADKAMLVVEENIAKTLERDGIASFLNRLYGWTVENDGWKTTAGPVLVEELWALITNIS